MTARRPAKDAGRQSSADPSANGSGPPVPTDIESEALVLGASLTWPKAWDVVSGLPDRTFYDHRHQAVLAAMRRLSAEGKPVDIHLLAGQLAAADELDAAGGKPYLMHLQEVGASVAVTAALCEQLLGVAEQRHWATAAIELALAAKEADLDACRRLAESAARGVATVSVSEPDPDLEDFLAEPEPEYDWIVPGLLERADRVILTGGEGDGKSTLFRQLAVQFGAGIHPFTLEPMDPHGVLIVDVENSKRQVRRALRPLRLAARDRLGRGRLRVRVENRGIDLTDSADAEWLRRRVGTNQPDVLFIGPIYKLASGDPTEEGTAKAVSAVIDRLRAEFGVVIFLEAHTPHPASPRAPRVLRPYGASLWLRWPEFGLHLDKTGLLRHWRGARDERDWPAALKRGGDWPWTVAEWTDGTAEPTGEDLAIRRCQTAVLLLLAGAPDGEFSTNDVGRILRERKANNGRSGWRDETVQDALRRLVESDEVDSRKDSNSRVMYRYRDDESSAQSEMF